MDDKNNLINKYQNLEPLSRRILQVFAALLRYENATSFDYFAYKFNPIEPYSELHKILMAQLSTDSNARLTEQKFKDILKSLKSQGFINNVNLLTSANLVYIISRDLEEQNNRLVLTGLFKSCGLFFNKFEPSNYFVNKNSYITNMEHISKQNIRFLNFQIHTNNDDFLQKPIDKNSQQQIIAGYYHLFLNVKIDEEWVKSRQLVFQHILCVINLMSDVHIFAQSSQQKVFFIKLFVELPELPTANTRLFEILNMYIQQLRIKYAQQILPIDQKNESNAWVTDLNVARNNLLASNSKESLKYFEKSIKNYSTFFEREHWYWQLDNTILLFIALVAEGKFQKVETLILSKLKKYSKLFFLCRTLNGIKSLLCNDFTDANNNFKNLKNIQDVPYQEISLALTDIDITLYFWFVSIFKPDQLSIKQLQCHFSECAKKPEKTLSAYICAELLGSKNADALSYKSGSIYKTLDITNLIKIKPEWEYTIDALASILEVDSNQVIPKRTKKIKWLLELQAGYVEVQEQQLKNGTTWSTGKKISAQRIAAKEDLDYASPQDLSAFMALEADPYYKNRYYWNLSKLLPTLVEHPFLFSFNEPNQQLLLMKDTPELIVKTTNKGYSLKLSQKVIENKKIHLEKITPNKYKIFEFSEQYIKLAKLVGDGLIIPELAKDKLVRMISQNNPELKINTDVVDDNIKTVKGNSLLYLQLTPHDNGVMANMFVSPFGEGRGYHFPGTGTHSLVTQNEKSEIIKIKRNYKEELENVTKLKDLCPIFNVGEIGKFEFVYDDLEQALQLLSELENYKKDFELIVEWPKGEAIKFKGNITDKNLKINIKSNKQWFEYNGEVEIDNNQVLNLSVLLELLNTESSSRFLQLKDGNFIALSERFKEQLAALKISSEGNKIYDLGSKTLEDLTNNALEVNFDKKWQTHLNELKKRSAFIPELPATLQTELRDYQREGFNYLSRFCHWHIGVCLADDMGLGKTVQTIALILEQAAKGPALVVAPTSVCYNWIEELNKFAPSIRAHIFHNENQRTELINKMQAGDVLVSSYNLVQYENDILVDKEWNLLILDEAQNIKNHTTKRFKAVCKINTKCKVALSGTPIENHLGELWSLFRFLNPGLLGSLEHFQNKFINPIGNKNNLVKQFLKKIIQPYILRRTKSEVLKELPQKIEQSIYIEQSAEEQAFYESVRQESLKRISTIGVEPNKRFSILAEITKLRQACCHSSLVNPQINLDNSKLNAFLEIMDDLIANNHKVLVFSQYVGYLAIVKDLLEKNNIKYQYIDGATPINKRKAFIDDFQNGHGGDAFLISLKAGGAGLNLTVADYVIILDPWWNPAVEDQAADRAHRIGQTRTVTVYRLIVKNSIEEKIIQLHKDKRDLAGDLLSGQDVGAKLSAEDLLNLMQK